jgi:hypothetical protein
MNMDPRLSNFPSPQLVVLLFSQFRSQQVEATQRATQRTTLDNPKLAYEDK